MKWKEERINSAQEWFREFDKILNIIIRKDKEETTKIDSNRLKDIIFIEKREKERETYTHI